MLAPVDPKNEREQRALTIYTWTLVTTIFLSAVVVAKLSDKKEA